MSVDAQRERRVGVPEQTKRPGSAVACACRWLVSSSRSAGSTSTNRTPAPVLASPTEMRPFARSMSCHVRAAASLIRRPASSSVAISARRPAGRARGLASSSVAASISATICSAESRYTGRVRRDPVQVQPGQRAMHRRHGGPIATRGGWTSRPADEDIPELVLVCSRYNLTLRPAGHQRPGQSPRYGAPSPATTTARAVRAGVRPARR
jgi:hypothetical protein